METSSTEMTTATFNQWIDYLNAVRDGEIAHADGSYRRVVYDSAYSDEPQVLEGEIERASRRMGKPFSLEGCRIRGFTVNSNGRDVGRITEITGEVPTDTDSPEIEAE